MRAEDEDDDVMKLFLLTRLSWLVFSKVIACVCENYSSRTFEVDSQLFVVLSDTTVFTNSAYLVQHGSWIIIAVRDQW